MSSTGSDEDLTPPTPIQVAQRSLILSALVCRGHIELDAGNPEAQSLAKRIVDWLEPLDLNSVMEPNEAAVINSPLGQVPKQIAINATWQTEGLAIIAWALGRGAFPLHDEQVDQYTVTDSLEFLIEDAAEFIRMPELRTAKELHACRELEYAIHCRLRNYIREKNQKDFTRWIEMEWLEILKIDANHLIAGNDLAIGGRPIFEVDEQNVQTCAQITWERHRAAIWLFGEYPIYSELPVDT